MPPQIVTPKVTWDEIKKEAECHARHLYQSLTPEAIQPIVVYGRFVATGERASSQVEAAFYRAFWSVHKPGYADFTARFQDSVTMLIQFEDTIALNVYRLSRGPQ